MKYIVSLIVLVTVSASVLYYTNSPKKNNTGLSPVVRLYHEETGTTYCTGTVVSNKYVVTATHCVQNKFGKINNDVVLMSGKFEKKVNAKVRYVSIDQDVTVLIGNFTEFRKIKINTNHQLKRGEKLLSIGYRNSKLYASDGTFKTYFDFLINTGDINLLPGMSGGPLLNEAYELVGVNSGTQMENQYFAQIINLEGVLGDELHD